MSKIYTNSGKSVKERLLNLSRAEHYNPQMMISRYMQERLLYRLSISNYRERFILKGGALLYAYDRFEARPTLDIDFMATRINNDKENIKRIIKEICNVECAPDGADYDADTVETEDITVNKEYHGVRVSVVAHLGCPYSVDETLRIAETVVTIEIACPENNDTITKTLCLTEEERAIAYLRYR